MGPAPRDVGEGEGGGKVVGGGGRGEGGREWRGETGVLASDMGKAAPGFFDPSDGRSYCIRREGFLVVEVGTLAARRAAGMLSGRKAMMFNLFVGPSPGQPFVRSQRRLPR